MPRSHIGDRPSAPAGADPRPARRILMIAPTSFFADYGCHVRILEEARVLRRLGRHVTIVTYYTGRDVDGLDIRRTLPIPWRRHYEVGSSRHKIAFDVLLGLRALPAAIALRPDVIHGHLHEGALVGGIVAGMLRRPLVFDYQGSLTAEMADHGFLRADGRVAPFVRRLERRIDARADAIVTSSSNAAARLVADGLGGRVHALPDCVDASVFAPDAVRAADVAALRSRLGIPAGRPVVVYLGLLARHQGTDHLLEAARTVVERRPDAHFVVMGFPGPHVYQARAEAMGIAGHVTFTGRVPYEQAPLHLALGDVAVAPKLGTTEGVGKVLNYMAMALPVVAFDLPASREFLQGDGCYAPPGDSGALAEGILGLLADPSAARARGASLRRRAVEGYDWLRAGRDLVGLYDGLIAGAARRVAEGRAAG